MKAESILYIYLTILKCVNKKISKTHIRVKLTNIRVYNTY